MSTNETTLSRIDGDYIINATTPEGKVHCYAAQSLEAARALANTLAAAGWATALRRWEGSCYEDAA